MRERSCVLLELALQRLDLGLALLQLLSTGGEFLFQRLAGALGGRRLAPDALDVHEADLDVGRDRRADDAGEERNGQ